MPVNPYQYSATPAGEQGGKAVTQDWDKELGGGVASGALPSGYNNYVQGWDPTKNQWAYNPNSGAKYGTLADGSWGELPGQSAPNVLTQGAAATPSGAPQAGDPNYYKYTSTGGAAYAMPPQQAAAAKPAPAAPAPGPTRGAPNPGATFTNPQGIRTPGAQPGAMQPGVQPLPAAPGTSTLGSGGNGLAQNMQNANPQDMVMSTQVVPIDPASFGSSAVQPGNVASTGQGMNEFGSEAVMPGPGGAAPATGVGADRSYPSNWNANNSPGLDNGNTPFATDPNTGASYETSPMYQWQLQQGMKNLRRQLEAGGRLNSSVGFNTLANFQNQLGANEANQQYQREFQQQQLGMQAALAQAAQQGASASQLAQMYMQMGGNLAGGASQYGNNMQNIIGQYMQNQGGNVLNTGATVGNAAINLATGNSQYTTQQGQARGDIYAGWGNLPGQFMNTYQQNRTYQPNNLVAGDNVDWNAINRGINLD